MCVIAQINGKDFSSDVDIEAESSAGKTWKLSTHRIIEGFFLGSNTLCGIIAEL